ncbi:DDE Tnp4 domain-containing protein [Abeliophyllum distichum]|uniref:DDE Tnp4 domain-containing protein n=1 Tax=Abeliophyllum distichum TaxID=126358 RepID=A0ABD1UND3_9LAMI
MALTNFILTVAGVSAVVLLLRSDVKHSASFFCHILHIRKWLEEESATAAKEIDYQNKDCVGAIDGTHIPAMISGSDVSSYRNRHRSLSQNVLAACNFDLEFIYILSGWEGSAHDSKLLNDALVNIFLWIVDLQSSSILSSISRCSISSPRFWWGRMQAELVLACAGLHNFIRKGCRSDEFPVEPDNEASSPSSPSLTGFEEDEDVFETQEQQRACK